MLHLLFSLFICTFCFAQVLPGARQAAICNSDAASSDDVFAVFNNPAGTAQIPWREAGIFYSPAPFGLKELAAGYAAFCEPLNFGTFSAGFMTFGYTLYRENKFLLSFSHRLTDDLFIGAAINYHNIIIDKYGSDGSFYLNAGVLGFITPDIHLGFDIINLNRSTFGSEQDQIPVVFNAGLSFNYENIFLLHMGVQKDIIYNYSLSCGMEYLIFDMLAIRTGVSTDPAKYSAGTGLHYGHFSFDYAFSWHNDLGITHQVGFIFSFTAFSNRQAEIRTYLENKN